VSSRFGPVEGRGAGAVVVPGTGKEGFSASRCDLIRYQIAKEMRSEASFPRQFSRKKDLTVIFVLLF
jgi:hypothetical protein